MVRLAPIEQKQQVINHVPIQTNNNSSNCNSPVSSNNGENMMQQQAAAATTSSHQVGGPPQTSPDSGVSLPSSPPLIEHTSPPPPPTIIPCAIHQPQALQQAHNHHSLMIAAIHHQGHPMHHHHHPRPHIPPPSHQPPHENGHGNSGGSNTPNSSPNNNGAAGGGTNSAAPGGAVYIQYQPEYYQTEHGYYIHHPDMQQTICTMPSDYGPAAVQMVSQNRAPPMQVPVQVPPGQVMQPYDGNITHLILSPTQFLPPAPAPGQRGVQQMHAPFIPANVPNSHYYSAVATGYPPPGPGNPHYHQLSGNHLQPQQQISHSPSPPNSYHKDDHRNQRQHVKVLRQQRDINSTMSTPAHSPSPRKHDLNGHYHHNNNHRRMNGASSVGTSEDGEESSSVPDDEDECNQIKDQLSGIQSPSVSDISPRAATLKWEIPPNLDSLVNIHDLRYDVLLSDNRNNVGTYKKIFQGASRVCMIRDLKPNQDYEVRLQAHYDKLMGDASDATKFRTPSCEPDQPKPPKLINSTKNSLHIRWVQPCDNGSSITHYILEYGEHKMISLTVKARTQYNIQKLHPATLYNVRLLAFNKNGPSMYSDIVQYATTGKPPPPMPSPPGLQLATSTTLRLFWDRQSQDERYMLQMYDVHSRRYSPVYNGSSTIYECCNLQRSTDYKFRLRADNEYGSSDWSAEVTYRTAFDRPGRPSKPQVKGKIQGEFFRAKWEPPTDRILTQADIKCYHLEISSGGKFERIYSGPEAEAICDRLSPGTTYQIRVSCEGPGGQLSNYSDVSTVTTEAIAPGQPDPPRAIDIQPYSAKLNWCPPDYNGGAPVLEYEVQLSGTLIYRGKDISCIAQDLVPGECYEGYVRAVNRIGAGQWSDIFRFQSSAAPPDAPEIDEIIVKSATHMIVTWKKPMENGAPILEYQLESSEDPEKSNFEVIYQGVQLSTDIRNLLPHTLYNFRLKAANFAGCSNYSPVITTQTFAAVPSAPQISKSDINDAEVTLNWSEPESNGSDILHYNIEFADQSLTTDGFLTEYKITNLLPETSYKFKIQAVNSIGSGPFSNTLKLQTLPPAPIPPNLESPGVGHNFIKLKWGEGKNVDFTKFTVEMFVQRAKDFQIVYSGTNYVCKVTKLQEQTEYTFRIKAGNDRAGTGKYSENYTFKTAAAMPSTVKGQTFSFDRINVVPQAIAIGGSQQLTTGGSPPIPYGGMGVVVHISWLASKYSDPKVTDPIEYIVQCSLEKDSAYTEIYRGLQTKCSIDCLVPGSSYFVRICPIRIMMNGGVGSSLQGQFSTPLRLDVPHLSEIKNSLNSPSMSSLTTMGSIVSGGTPSHHQYNQHQSVFTTSSTNNNSSSSSTTTATATNHHPHNNNLRQRSSSCGISPSYANTNATNHHHFQKDLVGNVSSSSTFGRNFLDVNPFSGGKQPLQNLVNYNYHNNLNNNQSHVNNNNHHNNNNNNNNLNGNFGAIKRVYGKLTAFYSKNRRRFTDTQKAVIWMLSFLILAFCCAAFLKIFLS